MNPEWDREFRESTEAWARNREIVDANRVVRYPLSVGLIRDDAVHQAAERSPRSHETAVGAFPCLRHNIARHPVRGRSVPPRGTRRFVTLWGLRQTAAGAFAASDAAGLVGPHGDLDAVSGAEFSHEAGEVGFDGAWGDVELAGDLVVGAALGYRHEDFLLAGGERFYRLPRW